MKRPALLALAACAACQSNEAEPRYQPRTRDVVITSVPVLVKEQQRELPFLARDFAKGGVLDGKEVYAFQPSTVTVVRGDTLRFTFVNPEDDAHDFVLDSLRVPIPGQASVHATWVATEPGIHPFVCDIPSHAPFMSGEVVVLTPRAVRHKT